MLWFGLGIGLQVGIPVGAAVAMIVVHRSRRVPSGEYDHHRAEGA